MRLAVFRHEQQSLLYTPFMSLIIRPVSRANAKVGELALRLMQLVVAEKGIIFFEFRWASEDG